HLCKLEDGLGYFPRVGWFERARLHEGLALLRSARPAEAIVIFDALFAERARIPPEHLDQLYRYKIQAHLDLSDYGSIRQCVSELAPSARTSADGSPDSTRALRAELDGVLREVRQMATLYRADRQAMLRVNRAFDLAGRLRRRLTLRRPRDRA